MKETEWLDTLKPQLCECLELSTSQVAELQGQLNQASKGIPRWICTALLILGVFTLPFGIGLLILLIAHRLNYYDPHGRQRALESFIDATINSKYRGHVVKRLQKLPFPSVKHVDCDLRIQSFVKPGNEEWFPRTPDSDATSILPNVYVRFAALTARFMCDFRIKRSPFTPRELALIMTEIIDELPLLNPRNIRVYQFGATKDFTFSCDDISEEDLSVLESKRSQAENPVASHLSEPRKKEVAARDNSVEHSNPPLILPNPIEEKCGLLIADILQKRKETEAFAMAAVLKFEQILGRIARDVSSENLGWDIESQDSAGFTRKIEVKGLATEGSVIITENEFRASVTESNFFLYIVENCGEPNIARILVLNSLSSLKLQELVAEYEISEEQQVSSGELIEGLVLASGMKQ